MFTRQVIGMLCPLFKADCKGEKCPFYNAKNGSCILVKAMVAVIRAAPENRIKEQEYDTNKDKNSRGVDGGSPANSFATIPRGA